MSGRELVMVDEYNEEFFEYLREGALRSAEVVVPLVLDLVQPRSVVDVGCGTGCWLATFERHGIGDYLGIDAFAPRRLLEISRERFVLADLTQSLELGRRFDLAISLEVAEHLPDTAARSFVESLTRLAPAVLFSAAIPGQGGTNHLNEQWPDYWSRLFLAYGFEAVDVIRPQIWRNERVELWYAQNMVLYVEGTRRADFPQLRRAAAGASVPLAAVHPRLFAERERRLSESLRACADATARTEHLIRALRAERESGQALNDRIKCLEQVAAELEARADHFRNEGMMYQAQAGEAWDRVAWARQAAERYQVEVTEAQEQAEMTRREAQQCRAEVERLRAECARAEAEAEILHAELKRYRLMSEPSNMSLLAYLRAMPQVIIGTLRRSMQRRRIGSDR
jgi:SAM-dependent methyltransferase